MKKSDIIITPKISKFELDLHMHDFTEEELMSYYESQGLNAEEIYQSHVVQQKVLEKLYELFPNQILLREYITREKLAKAKLVICVGGDNHFKYVSHFITDQLFLGINSDPSRSVGALLSADFDTFLDKLNDIYEENFNVNEWRRISFEIDGKKKGLATTELFIGESERHNMSRYVLNFNDEDIEHKNSGLLIANGAGSTGWYNSAIRTLKPEGDSFSRNSKEFRWIGTEPYMSKFTNKKLLTGKILDGEELHVTSLSDSSGILLADSARRFPLRLGSKIVISHAEKSLKVISFK